MISDSPHFLARLGLRWPYLLCILILGALAVWYARYATRLILKRATPPAKENADE